MALGDGKLYFSTDHQGMDGNDVDKVLDPLGDTVQGLVRGKRGAGRLEVTVLWPQIAKALDAGVPVKTIWEALSQNGLVSIKRRGFAREVQARREGPGSSALAAKPAAEVNAPQPLGSEAGSRGPEPPPAGSGAVEAAAESPARARPSWLTEPPPATNRHAVYKPPHPEKTKS
jgi:hypothetical protein